MEFAGGPLFFVATLALLPVFKLYAPRSLWTVAFLTIGVVLFQLLDRRFHQRLETSQQRTMNEAELSERRLLSLLAHGSRNLSAAAFAAFGLLAVFRQL